MEKQDFMKNNEEDLKKNQTEFLKLKKKLSEQIKANTKYN
jgi:hypothetical protein